MLSRRMQLQVIVDLLAGRPAPYEAVAEDFEESLRACYLAVSKAAPGQAVAALARVLRYLPNRDIMREMIVAGTPGAGPRSLPSFADLAASVPALTWLWPNWIPRGMLTLLGGAPGTGKSYVALDLARRVVAGEPFPDGAPAAPAGSRVIYVDGEGAPQLLKARLSAWTFDARRLLIMQPPAHESIDLDCLDDQDRMIEAFQSARPALVVIDSFSAITSRGENRLEDVREILGFLAALAAGHACAIVLVHHLRKRQAALAGAALRQDDFRGSTHVTAAPRSVLGLSIVQTGPTFERSAPRRLEVVKSNLGRYPEPLGITFEALGPDAASLHYGPDPQPYRPPSQVDGCAAWLLATLRDAGEPLSAAEIVALARDAGFSRSVVFRARELAGGQVVDTQGRKAPDNRWRLAEAGSDGEETTARAS